MGSRAYLKRDTGQISGSAEIHCKGPDEKRSAYHQDKADHHAIWAKFHELSAENQRIFMALWEHFMWVNKQESGK
jgi:hypothetical protein